MLADGAAVRADRLAAPAQILKEQVAVSLGLKLLREERNAEGSTHMQSLPRSGMLRARPICKAYRCAWVCQVHTRRNFGLPNDCALHSPRSRDTHRTYARPRTATAPPIFIPL